MTRRCAFDPECDREPVATSASGTVHANCAAHEREAMSFFGESWHDQVRAGVLRPSIVGGLPLTSPDPAPGAPVPTLSPQGLSGRVQRSAGAPRPGARVGSRAVVADAGERARRGPRSSGSTPYPATWAAAGRPAR